MQAFLWHSSALLLCSKLPPSLLCQQNVHGLSGHDLFDNAIPHWHREVWWCSATSREGNETSGSWGCLMPVLLPEDWFCRGLAAQVCRINPFGSKSSFDSLPCCFISRQKEKPTSGQVYVKWKVPRSSPLICVVRLTFQSCTRFKLCVVRERNAKRNNNKVYGIKRWLCHSNTEYVL